MPVIVEIQSIISVQLPHVQIHIYPHMMLVSCQTRYILYLHRTLIIEVSELQLYRKHFNTETPSNGQNGC